MHTAHIDPQSDPHRIQTCADHSRSVADLAKSILAPCGLGSTGYLAGLLHDCGKFTDEFDEYITKASNNETIRKGSVIHTFAGVRCIMELFHAPNDQSAENIAAEVIAISIGSHHGLIDLWNAQTTGTFQAVTFVFCLAVLDAGDEDHGEILFAAGTECSLHGDFS